jgi:hypothetical protein
MNALLSTMVCRLPSSPPQPSSEASTRTSTHLASATLSIVFLAAAAFLPAAAQSGPTRQEQMACRGDAGKLCAEHVGKPQEMNACLRANKAKLSDGCRTVLEARGG